MIHIHYKKAGETKSDFHSIGNACEQNSPICLSRKWGELPDEIADLDSLTRDVRRRVIPKNDPMRAECCLSNDQRHGSITRNARVTSRTVKLHYRRQNNHGNTQISRPQHRLLRIQFSPFPCATRPHLLTTFNSFLFPRE